MANLRGDRPHMQWRGHAQTKNNERDSDDKFGMRTLTIASKAWARVPEVIVT